MTASSISIGGFRVQLSDYARAEQAPTGLARSAPARQNAPSKAEKVRDEPDWLYQGLHGNLSTRRLRVWRLAPNHVVAVISERSGASGTSLTNAAESIQAQLRHEYPGQLVEIVEHWPDDPHSGGRTHYDTVTFPNSGRWPVWTSVSGAALRTVLGDSLNDGRDDQDAAVPANPPTRPTPDPDVEQVDLGDGWSLFRVDPDDPRIDPRFQERGGE